MNKTLEINIKNKTMKLLERKKYEVQFILFEIVWHMTPKSEAIKGKIIEKYKDQICEITTTRKSLKCYIYQTNGYQF